MIDANYVIKTQEKSLFSSDVIHVAIPKVNVSSFVSQKYYLALLDCITLLAPQKSRFLAINIKQNTIITNPVI